MISRAHLDAIKPLVASGAVVAGGMLSAVPYYS